MESLSRFANPPCHPPVPSHPSVCSTGFSSLTTRATALCASKSSISPTATFDHALVDIRYGDSCEPKQYPAVPLTA